MCTENNSSGCYSERMVHTDKDRAAFAQRLQLAADKAGLPARGRGAMLSKHLELTPKAVSKYFCAESIPSREIMAKLAHYLGVSVSWLQYGQPELVRIDERASQRLIPVIDYVQAGTWTESYGLTGFDGGTETLPVDAYIGIRAFALRVNGDSMMPEIQQGDVVIVDPDMSPRPGDFVVARNGIGEATIKQYRPRGVNERGQEWFELVPLNNVYAPMRSDMQEIDIIGVVVEHRKYLRR